MDANANTGTESHSNAHSARTRSADTRIRTIVVATDVCGMGAHSHTPVGANGTLRHTIIEGRCNHMAVTKTYSPKQLAAEIGVDPKVLRAYLRKNHTRAIEAKNTTWIIPESVAKAARKSFEKNVATEAKS